MVTLAALAVLIVVDAPPVARLILALPAAGTAIAYLEALLKFCVAFGSRGILNFGALGTFTVIADSGARARDRLRALQIIVGGSLIGLGAGVVAALIPL